MAELSKKAYHRFLFDFGKKVADSIAAEVRSGKRDPQEAEEWSLNLEEASRQSRNHRDVPPKYWRDWEDGEWP